jgi:hypothetical protein
MTSSGIPLYTVRAKSLALTPCEHRSDKNRSYAAKGLKQNLKHCKQLRKLYFQTEKLKKTMIQAMRNRRELTQKVALTHNSVKNNECDDELTN